MNNETHFKCTHCKEVKEIKHLMFSDSSQEETEFICSECIDDDSVIFNFECEGCGCPLKKGEGRIYDKDEVYCVDCYFGQDPEC